MLKVLLFLKYYLQKRLSVFCRIYHTSNPLTLRWRWHHWKKIYESQKKAEQAILSGKRAF